MQTAGAGMQPMDALQRFFEGGASGPQGIGAASGPWGCMLGNTVLELAGEDDALAARASDHLMEAERRSQHPA